jgi:hypothetical protein
MNRQAMRTVGRTKVQAQSSNGRVQFIDDTQCLTVHGFFKVAEEGLYGGEVRSRDERSEKQRTFATVYGQLAELALLAVAEYQDLFDLLLHG